VRNMSLRKEKKASPAAKTLVKSDQRAGQKKRSKRARKFSANEFRFEGRGSGDSDE